MDISIIVCTYNRCESLRGTLQAIAQQQFESLLKVELLVVDNNSKDKTRHVISELESFFLFPMRYIFEPEQGLSAARNRGIAEALGEWILFTDDDIIPDSRWVASLWRAARHHNASAVCGPIVPLWEKEPPRWLKDTALQGHLALLDRGDKVIVNNSITQGSLLFGANMGFRREAFQRHGLFRTDLGAGSTGSERGEEVEFLERILMAGEKVVYEPEAIVRHRISAARMSLGYMRKTFYQAGKSYASYRYEVKKFPLWLLRQCFMDGFKVASRYLTFSLEAAIRAESQFWYKIGMLMGSRRKA